MCRIKYLVGFVLAVFGNLLYGQDDSLFHRYQLQVENYSIEYVIFGDINKGKLPAFVYCTGSLAYPLFIDTGKKLESTLPFDINKVTKNFHLIVLSKNAIPVIAKENDLNNEFLYVDNITKKIPEDFFNSNTLDFYTKANSLMVDQIAKLEFINKNSILIVGHSAGARVATKVAGQNHNISGLAYLSCEPLGRYYEKLRSCKNKEDIEKSLINWKKICNTRYVPPNGLSSDSNYTWFSNSENIIDDLLLLNIPIYAAYGTKDPKSEGMILIPYEFYKHNKNNLKFMPYDDMDHSFFGVNNDGSINYEKNNFDKIIQDILIWWAD